MRLCSTWWDSESLMNAEALEEILLGLSSQIAEREDSFFCGDVRDKLFGPMEFSRRDLAALNIMRGRDSGLPDYNTVRKCYGLETIKRWQDINPTFLDKDPVLAERIFQSLDQLYGDLVDVYVGGKKQKNTHGRLPQNEL